MSFHREGYQTLIAVTLFSALLVLLSHYFFPVRSWLHYIVYATAAFLIIMILQFFRSPSRKWTKDPGGIVAPADGKVVVIEEVEEPEYLRGKWKQVSIFMSPVNVHVNRNPISGRVEYAKYHPGKYLVAWHPKSSTENERTTVVITSSMGKVLFRQIAGALARRICCYVKEGDQVQQSDQMGFIKFGSRVDVLVPLDSTVLVSLGEHVKGGVTVLARFAG